MVGKRTSNEWTTIRISKKVKEELRKLELHKRETDEQIIKRLITAVIK